MRKMSTILMIYFLFPTCTSHRSSRIIQTPKDMQLLRCTFLSPFKSRDSFVKSFLPFTSAIRANQVVINGESTGKSSNQY